MRIVGSQPFGGRDVQQAIICRHEDVFSLSVRLGSLSDNQLRNRSGHPQCVSRRKFLRFRNARENIGCWLRLYQASIQQSLVDTLAVRNPIPFL